MRRTPHPDARELNFEAAADVAQAILEMPESHIAPLASLARIPSDPFTPDATRWSLAMIALSRMPVVGILQEGPLVEVFGYLRHNGLLPTAGQRLQAIVTAARRIPGVSTAGLSVRMSLPGTMVTVVDDQLRVLACEGRGAQERAVSREWHRRPLADLAAFLAEDEILLAARACRPGRPAERASSSWVHTAFHGIDCRLIVSVPPYESS